MIDVAAPNTTKPFGGRVCLALCKIALMMPPPHPAHPMIIVTSSPRTALVSLATVTVGWLSRCVRVVCVSVCVCYWEEKKAGEEFASGV